LNISALLSKPPAFWAKIVVPNVLNYAPTATSAKGRLCPFAKPWWNACFSRALRHNVFG
jgi:hypothetical protein